MPPAAWTSYRQRYGAASRHIGHGVLLLDVGDLMQRILVTGDRGLIGTVLRRRLQEAGHEVIGYDVAGDEVRDVIDTESMDALVATCTGVVHLAAVSRVILGEREPARCRLVNVQGTRNVLSAAARSGKRHPWILYGSSREVYGQAERLPVRESAPLRPMNVYARVHSRVGD